MLVTPSGIVILVRLSREAKALSAMLVTLFGIIVGSNPRINVFVAVSIIALQLSLLS